MDSEEVRLRPLTRMIAGVLGVAVLGTGVLGGWELLRQGSYLWAIGTAVGGVAIGRLFLEAAYRGTSEPWRRALPGHGTDDD